MRFLIFHENSFFQDSLNRKFKRTAFIWNKKAFVTLCLYCHFWSIEYVLLNKVLMSFKNQTVKRWLYDETEWKPRGLTLLLYPVSSPLLPWRRTDHAVPLPRGGEWTFMPRQRGAQFSHMLKCQHFHPSSSRCHLLCTSTLPNPPSGHQKLIFRLFSCNLHHKSCWSIKQFYVADKWMCGDLVTCLMHKHPQSSYTSRYEST